MTLEDRRKEYLREYVALKDIPTWMEEMNKNQKEGKSILFYVSIYNWIWTLQTKSCAYKNAWNFRFHYYSSWVASVQDVVDGQCALFSSMDNQTDFELKCMADYCTAPLFHSRDPVWCSD